MYTNFVSGTINNNQMSNLSKETIDRINSEADLYGFVVPYDGSNTFYVDDKVKGYQAGATEWAGRAKPGIDLLEKMIEEFTGAAEMSDKEYDKELIKKSKAFIAKYKEVNA